MSILKAGFGPGAVAVWVDGMAGISLGGRAATHSSGEGNRWLGEENNGGGRGRRGRGSQSGGGRDSRGGSGGRKWRFDSTHSFRGQPRGTQQKRLTPAAAGLD